MATRQERRAAVERYAEARRALDENSIAEYMAGIDYETGTFRRLNRDVWEAEPGVPWWHRWLIDHRILRELDYWQRMRGTPR